MLDFVLEFGLVLISHCSRDQSMEECFFIFHCTVFVWSGCSHLTFHGSVYQFVESTSAVITVIFDS